MQLTHKPEEAHKVTLVLGINAIVLDRPLHEVTVRARTDLLLAHAVIERERELGVDGLVQSDGHAVAAIEGECGRRVDGLVGVVVDVDVVRQRLLARHCAHHEIVAVLGVLGAALLHQTFPVARGVLAHVDAQTFDAQTVVVDVDVLEVVFAIVFEIAPTHSDLRWHETQRSVFWKNVGIVFKFHIWCVFFSIGGFVAFV